MKWKQFWNYYSKIDIICLYSVQLSYTYCYYQKVCSLKNMNIIAQSTLLFDQFFHICMCLMVRMSKLQVIQDVSVILKFLKFYVHQWVL